MYFQAFPLLLFQDTKGKRLFVPDIIVSEYCMICCPLNIINPDNAVE